MGGAGKSLGANHLPEWTSKPRLTHGEAWETIWAFLPPPLGSWSPSIGLVSGRG